MSWHHDEYDVGVSSLVRILAVLPIALALLVLVGVLLVIDGGLPR